MNRQELISQIKQKQSFLCIGLDTDIDKIPSHLLELEDPIFEFNKKIIDSTKEFCVFHNDSSASSSSSRAEGVSNSDLS